MEHRVAERAKGAGALGQYLKERLSIFDLTDFDCLPFASQISFVYKPVWNGRRPYPLARAALSYLACDVPIQVHLPEDSLERLVEYTCPVSPLPPSNKRPHIMLTRKLADSTFPFKSAPQATVKANLFLDEVGRDAWRLDKIFCREVYPYLSAMTGQGISNDVATAFILYAWCLRGRLSNYARWAASVVLYPAYAKEVSNFLKSVGGNATPLGAALVEGDTLQGRGAKPLDLYSEASFRTNLDNIRRDMLVEQDLRKLERAIRKIFETEIVKEEDSYHVAFPTYEEHWKARWEWAVNGSHSNLVDRRVRGKRPKNPDIHRWHRRAWLEEISEDPRIGWDGTTYVSASPKLEHGKTRTIFACDTINYLAFEHLLGPVERRWRGRRVILNPGKGGHLGMVERVSRNRERSGISLMLDYDDFNSHHSTEAMQLLIRVLCEMVNYPPDLATVLIDSFDKESVFVGGRKIGHIAGTLMSGHRGTTFINSVLNMAYLMVELGDDFVLSRPTLHVGDDVYFGVRNYSEAGYVIDSVMKSGLRMNPSKQSVGHVSTEFLRVSTGSRDSYGYLARSVASIVSGNWVTMEKLDPFEALTTIVASARTIANRSQNSLVPLLLRSAVQRALGPCRLDDTIVDELLCGGLAINNGPLFRSGGTYRYIEVTPTAVKRDMYGHAPLRLNATHDFLSHCATELEVEALSRAGITVERDMGKSSYSKTLKFDISYFDTLLTSEVRTTPAVGSVSAETLLHAPSPRGLLTDYPLLVLAKNRLPEYLVRELLSACGGNYYSRQLELDAWGEYKHGCIVNTAMSYADASSLGKRTQASVLTSTRRCYV